MSISVELTYDMGKALGEQRIEFESAKSVKDLMQLVREIFLERGEDFEGLSRLAAIAVNGVLVNHRIGMKTPLADGDTVVFVKAAAGG